MKMIILMVVVTIELLSSGGVNGGIFNKGEWNDLKVTWGINPFSSMNFVSMPLTESSAISKGWRRDGSQPCSVTNGNRYLLNNDRAAMIIYNAKGELAGLATSLPKNLPFGFPSAQLQKLFVDESNAYTISAYFIDPSTVCSTTTPKKQNSIGDRLVFKGSGMELNVPLQEKNLPSFWTQGKCFATMGVHYWAKIDGTPLNENTSGDDMVPLFLLYNGGQLNGFGFAFNANLTSPRYEHPTPDVLNYFFKKIPSYFSDSTKSGVLSTIHVYMDSTPRLDWC